MSFSSDRREFLKKGLAVTATVFAGGHFLLMNPRESRAQALPDLVVVNGSDPAADHTCGSRCFGRNGTIRKTRE